MDVRKLKYAPAPAPAIEYIVNENNHNLIISLHSSLHIDYYIYQF